MNKIKVSEATNTQLDWLVAKANGLLPHDAWVKCGAVWWKYDVYSPTTNWSQMGPIIDREDIALSPLPDGLWRAYSPEGTQWVPRGELGLEVFKWKHKQEGYHPLIAAARCYVVSKLGDVVEVPEELS